MRFTLALSLILLATPALAQFPPPGVYACVDGGGKPVGELNLFVAGDYSFKGQNGNSASGQIASAGKSINPLSGPLKDMQLEGAFATDDKGVTRLRFRGPGNLEISCR